MTSGADRIKVLVVDDSAIVRKILSDAISAEPDLEVVGTAPDPYIARDKILALKPDVVTLDIEMPRMDGLTFLKKLMEHHPIPVVVISSLAQNGCQTSLDALRLGAVEVLAKPGGPYSVGELRINLAYRIRAAAASRLRAPGNAVQREPPRAAAASYSETAFPQQTIIAIGASTGGTEAIAQLLTQLPANSPGIVIAQHIPAVFSRAFASRLNEICSMDVKEACDGDAVPHGTALVAPGNLHMLLKRTNSGYRVQIKDGPQVCYQRPSVDVLFSSVAESAGSNGIGILLTGMGCDGASGLLKMKSHGAFTIAQDEESCVVFGMPKEAVRLDAADRVVSLNAIPSTVLSHAR
jgi:two-component system, chemotaxis family, protein-glutamate methylesterase/glutaminase